MNNVLFGGIALLVLAFVPVSSVQAQWWQCPAPRQACNESTAWSTAVTYTADPWTSWTCTHLCVPAWSWTVIDVVQCNLQTGQCAHW